MLLLPEAGANLLGQDMMTKLGIGLTIGHKKIQVSLNLLSTKGEEKILPEVCIREGNQGGLDILSIQVELENKGESARRRQYPIPLEGKMVLQPIIEGLLRDGLLTPCVSPFTTLYCQYKNQMDLTD